MLLLNLIWDPICFSISISLASARCSIVSIGVTSCICVEGGEEDVGDRVRLRDATGVTDGVEEEERGVGREGGGDEEVGEKDLCEQIEHGHVRPGKITCPL